MKTLHLLLAALLAFQVAAQPVSPTSFGEASLLADDWLFLLDDDSAAVAPDYDDSRWQHVQIPHDWGVRQPMSPDRGSCQGYLPGGIAWYRRHFTASPAGRLYVYFEGVYNRSTVYLNGHCLGHRPSGFASFLYDLTPYVRTGGDNVLAVRVDHSRQDDSRWYTGSGIYRPVWLVRAPDTHLELWGTTWKLKTISAKKAVVEVTVADAHTDPQHEGTASAKKHCTTLVEILDATGRVVAATASGRPLAKEGCGSVFSLTIPHPRRWTLDDPYLYKVRARMMDEGREVDRSEVPLGLRTLTFSPDRGFALNGEWMKVKGVCLHDDAGVLGTAVPRDVWKRRLMNLKQTGANAIRMSHNPHLPALYDLCDTLGLLVMDEASDEWEFPKRKWLKGWNRGTPGFEGTYDYFEQWIDRDVADMVRRDRCHPSVFLWSIGNEVDYPNDPYSHPVLDGNGSDFTQPMYGGYKPEQPNAERIGLIAQRLAKVVRQLDDSRAVTGALAGVVMSNETAYPDAVDVVGYNYTESRYQVDHQRYPQRIIYGSENRHDLPAWKAVRDNGHIFGQFLWTGIDYLGESGPWPARGSEAGLLDLAGFIKPLGHYRAALWAQKPVCYIGTYPAGPNRRNYRGREQREWVSPYAPALWNYDEGQRVRVVCYTNAPAARLTLNGQPVGGEPTRDPATDILYWDITYAPGTLRCEVEGAAAAITTAGRPYALRATADKTELSADDILQIVVEVIDEQGTVIPLADNEITCRTPRGVRLLGMENGDIRDTSDKTDARCRVHGGRLLAYVARTQDSEADGAARIRFTSPLLKATEVAVQLR